MATVTAGLKCAPETTARVWTSTNRTNTCTRPITDQSMNGAGFCADGWVTNSETAIVTKKTRNSVPRNSARYEAGPRSSTGWLLLWLGRRIERAQSMHRVRRVCTRLLAALAGAAILVAGCGDGGNRDANVTLALDFTPNAVHAPIYAAVRRGFDRRNGVRLRIQPPGSAP